MTVNVTFAADMARFSADWGIHFPGAVDYLPPEFRNNYDLAMDAQPGLVTASNSGIPFYMTNYVDPDLLRILTAKNKAAEILGEKRKGDWTDDTATFPVVEATGHVAAYGDYNAAGRSNVNTNFPMRESFLFQTFAEWGERQAEKAGRAKINWAAEVREAAAVNLMKFQNLTYFYGVAGLQNYGLLNDPSLSAALTPAVKAAGGAKWFNSNSPNATANEVYTDIEAIFAQLVAQAGGNVEQTDAMTLALSPKSAVAMTFTNSFGITLADMLKKSFPNMRIVTAVQYGAVTAQNPQGSAAGEVVQLIADEVEGQETGFCAFNEKLRAHSIVVESSAFKQKNTSGTFGAVIRQPFAIAQMIGV